MAGAGGRDPETTTVLRSGFRVSFAHFLSLLCAKPAPSPQAVSVSRVGRLLSQPSTLGCLRPSICPGPQALALQTCPGETDSVQTGQCDPPGPAEMGMRSTPKARRGQSQGGPAAGVSRGSRASMLLGLRGGEGRPRRPAVEWGGHCAQGPRALAQECFPSPLHSSQGQTSKAEGDFSLLFKRRPRMFISCQPEARSCFPGFLCRFLCLPCVPGPSSRRPSSIPPKGGALAQPPPMMP